MSKVLRYVIASFEDEDINATAVGQGEGQRVEVEIPKGAELLPGIGATSKGIVVYAVGDPDEDSETQTREFFLVGNGQDLPEGVGPTTFRDTFKPGPGSGTLHVFDLVSVLA